MSDRLLDMFLQLVAIPSPSLKEREVADFIVNHLRSLGLSPSEDNAGEILGGNAGNVILHMPAGKGIEASANAARTSSRTSARSSARRIASRPPKILLSAHMDTVETGERSVKPIVSGDWVTSDGNTILGADDKSAVAILLEIIQQIVEQNVLHPELLFVFSVAEESHCIGSAEMDPLLYDGYDAAIIIDNHDSKKIVTASPTHMTLRITISGKGGHAGYPAGTLNAGRIMAKAIADLPQGQLDNYTTANIGIVKAGTAVNVIPDTAYAEYEIRSHKKELMTYWLKQALSSIESAVRTARIPPRISKDHEGNEKIISEVGAMVDVEIETDYEAYAMAPDSAPVKMLSDALKDILGEEPKLIAVQGGSDANVFNVRGLPSIVYGCGFRDVHSRQEKLYLPDFRLSFETIWKMVTEMK